MRTRPLRLSILLVAVTSLSCTGDSSFEPQVVQLFEVDQIVGHDFQGDVFYPHGIKGGSGNLIYLFDLGDAAIRRYTLEGVFMDEWNGGGAIGGVRAMDLASNGEVVVAATYRSIVVLDESGNPVRGWELPFNQRVDALMVAAGGEVVVSTATEGQILVFTAAGAHLGEWFVPERRTIVGLSTAPGGNPLLIFSDSLVEYTVNGEPVREWAVYRATDAVSDGEGGLFVTIDWGKVLHLDPQGTLISEWWRDADGNTYLDSPSGIARDANGDLHVVDRSLARIVRFSKAGDLENAWTDDPEPDGSLIWAGPSRPGHDGGFHIMDRRFSRIQSYDSSGEFQFAWGERGRQTGMLAWPVDLVLEAGGSFYVLEGGRVQRFSATGEYELGWKTLGNSKGLAIDEDGNIYVSDREAVVKYDPDGTPLDEFDGFVNPDGIAVKDGLLYVVELTGKEVRVLDTDGVEQRRWCLVDQRDRSRIRIAVDSEGYVYIADYWPDRVEIYSPEGEHLAALEGKTLGHMIPAGVAVDASDRILVSDVRNAHLKIFKKLPGAELQ